jgi:hypothetical protein
MSSAKSRGEPISAPPTVLVGTLDVRSTSKGGTLEGQGLELRVDGEMRGALPGTFEVPAGKRAVEIRDEAGRYDVFREEIQVDPGRTTTLAPRLIVRKGLVTVKAGTGAETATFSIRVHGEERRFPVVPIALDLGTDVTYELVVRAPGARERIVLIDFSDGVAKKTLTIALEPR